MKKSIDTFEAEPYRFLSNFYYAPVVLDGVLYTTVEHAYQAAKSNKPESRSIVRDMPTPGYAKRAGRRLKDRNDWDAAKVEVMLDLLRQKFARGRPCAVLLEATGDTELIEGNTWSDRFWGVYNGEGQNMLGRLLMQVRAENRA